LAYSKAKFNVGILVCFCSNSNTTLNNSFEYSL